MRKVWGVLAGAATAVGLAATGAEAATNLLTNGDFETGNTSGWSISGLGGVESGSFFGIPGAESGADYAFVGFLGVSGDLSQSFSDTNGQTYTVRFWLHGMDTGSLWQVVLDNDTTHADTKFSGSSVPSGTGPNGWTFYTFSFTGTGSDSLSFLGNGSIGVDNVDVFAGTPEPAAWALMLAGFAGLGAALRGRRGKLAAA